MVYVVNVKILLASTLHTLLPVTLQNLPLMPTPPTRAIWTCIVLALIVRIVLTKQSVRNLSTPLWIRRLNLRSVTRRRASLRSPPRLNLLSHTGNTPASRIRASSFLSDVHSSRDGVQESVDTTDSLSEQRENMGDNERPGEKSEHDNQGIYQSCVLCGASLSTSRGITDIIPHSLPRQEPTWVSLGASRSPYRTMGGYYGLQSCFINRTPCRRA